MHTRCGRWAYAMLAAMLLASGCYYLEKHPQATLGTGVGAAGGAVVGGLAGHKKGAIIGGVVGPLAGRSSGASRL